ncbi:hypothetical protein B0F90DRAFT_1716338 [Multifurca ochricompacta]|uniref:Nephrocystin 3-like N-terminal domain-containing protein n=1 Tax=Multifurca ochricompacta TaxID=376703 RepID=A0AAD4M4T8_9AGAM|nr:hypothetical protein B0F90DRAFT_1716338 [Multifurca ochricompacta]
MSSETPTRKRREEVYNGLKTSLELLGNLVKISPVPGLEGTILTVKGIMDIVESAKHNKQACYDIGVKINKLISVVHSELKDRDDIDTDKGTRTRVDTLESSLSDISRRLSDLAQENAFRRAINRVADADIILDLDKEVDECLRNFMLGTQLSTGLDIKYLREEAVRTRVLEDLDTGGWSSDRLCLPGTRKRYINRIWEWIRGSDEPMLCWLNGVAGSGKSSISHELAATLHAKRQPYSCFFFRQDDASLAVSAIKLLAYGLSFVSGLRELIIQAMEQTNDTRINLTMEEQFMALIVTPLQEFASICPFLTVVLVIDGVDECPAEIRPSFLAAIHSGVPRLPSSVKMFFASRPRGDVRGFVEDLKPLEINVAVGVGQDDGDVEQFLQHELLGICKAAGLERTWTASQIKRDAAALSSKACGLFQWAKLASALLTERVRPREVIARILNVDASSTPEVNLDALYTEVLDIALPGATDDKDIGPLFRQVVGTVVVAKQPLTISAIRTLLKAGGVDDGGAIRTVLENLGCVLALHHTRSGAVVVRIGHPSFYDYVTSPQRCPPTWLIDLHQTSVQLGSHCFSLMGRKLKRDICRMRNDICDTLSAHHNGLRYACNHGFTHMNGDSGNLRMLETFLMEKLLEWLEVMSLLKLLDTAAELMQRTLADLQQQNISISHVEILQDAIRFVGRFGSVINKSAIHIYFSALPFTPQETMLYRVYSLRYRDIPRVTLGYAESWPEGLCTVRSLGGNEDTPRRLAFSADSSHLALSTPTHLVMASSLTGVQLRKNRFGSSDGDTDMPIAMACRQGYLVSVTSSLLLRICESRSLKEIQLSLSPSSAEKLSSSNSPEVSCATFDQNVNILFVGYHDGHIQLWRQRHSSWEPDKDVHPRSHPSPVHNIATAANLLASISKRELKIGPYGDSKPGDVLGETLTLTPKCLAEVGDFGNSRLSFAATSATSWACAFSLYFSTSDTHSVYVFTSEDQKGRRILTTSSPTYPVYALSPDTSVVTIVCDELLWRWDTASHSLIEKCPIPGIDRASTRLDRFPVISPDGHLLALCDGEVVDIWDLMQPPPKHPKKGPSIKAAGVILTDDCYIVTTGKQKWLARVRDDGTSEDIVQLGEHKIELLAMSADETKLASLSFYQGKTHRGLLEIAELNSRKRATTTWPVALHDSFTGWDTCYMEFSATGKHIAIVFFLSEMSYVCACDLESGSLRWTQLSGKLEPLAVRSLQGEELIVVRARDLWKIDLRTLVSGRHELHTRDPYRMATCYARFTSIESSSILEMASRLWDKPPWHTIWNADNVAREEAKIRRAAAHLEVHGKNQFGHWVLDNMGQRICCIPEEYCSKWRIKSQSSINHDRLALLKGDGAVVIINLQAMMEHLN